MDILIYIIVLMVCLSPIIMSHEFGHFLGARLTGTRVSRFVLGAGPIVYRKSLFAMALIPMGAFCDIDSIDYRSKSGAARILVSFAGSGFNFICALVLLIIAALFRPIVAPIVEVEPTGPAAIAGMESGDRIVSIDGTVVNDWQDVGIELVSRMGDTGELKVTTQRTEHAIPIQSWQSDQRQINPLRELGLARSNVETLVERSILLRFTHGVVDTVKFGFGTIKAGIDMLIADLSILTFFGNLQLSMQGAEHVDFMTSDNRSALHWTTWITVIALMSIGLGMVNLLTGPLVDGSQIISGFLAVLLRKPISERADRLLVIFGTIPGYGPLVLCIGYEINRVI